MELKDADVTTITTENLAKKRFRSRRLGVVSTLLLLILAAWAVWSWGFCRFYVGPGKMAVITAKTGSPLPPGQILAKPGQKGVLEDVLGEGRHIWNPLFYDWQIVDALYIPPGKVGVVTSQVGENLPQGEFLAEPGQKGTWRKVLGPGCYRLNPIGYSVDVIDAVSIPLGFAGVVTNLSGDPAPEGLFARPGQKGVRADVLQPGLYYINPREYEVSAVEVGVNQVSLVGESGGVVLTKNVVMDENNQLLQRLSQNLLDDQRRRREEYSQNTADATAPAPRAQSGMDYIEEFMDDPGAPARRALSKSLPSSSAPPGRARAVRRSRSGAARPRASSTSSAPS
ncbi:MAG: hypothetical protein LUE17_03860, partial [Planctomycetaceae bacterium]|nr:hypothetical protein [Planctomycetaceae bacterium]